MFEDFRSIPPLVAILWTAVMFWGGLAWIVYAIFANAQLKINKALELGFGDFNEIPDAQRNNIQKLCKSRLWAPLRLWFKGLLIIGIFGVFVFAAY
jgi:hypothetical protein